MSQDPASLDNLRDIVLPQTVPWLPPAVGWRLVGAAVLAVVIVASLRAVRRWRANAYRREALRELRALQAFPQVSAAPAKMAADVSALMKRAALAGYPRDAVADLTGPQWLAFLDSTGHTTDFSRGAAKDLWPLACGAPVGSANPEGVFVAARRWLRRHRPAERA
jgi:hypothetical protein